jgi:hypothetical protein
MASARPAPTAPRRRRSTIRPVLALAGAALIGFLGVQALVSSSAARSLTGDGGVSVFDDGTPAVTNLDPALLDALRRAATAAAGDGVDLRVNSGWRSAADQARLLQEAVSKYGSEEEAARWVATPNTSAHVSGDAVDIGGPGATAWLSDHGTGYGLCQIYDNEPWHVELRPAAVTSGCPRPYSDPTHDPRMQH